MPVIFWVVVLLVLIFSVVILSRIFFSLITMSLFHGAYYAGTSDERLQQVLELAAVQPGDQAVDLGSGDGRVVLALAQAGAQATGVELNPWLVFKSRWLLTQAGLDQQTHLICQNLWQHDLSPYDTVVIYGIGYIMNWLEAKLQRELKPGAKFISVYFKLPHLQPVRSLGEVHLYQF